MIILWVALGITVLFMFAVLVLLGLALAAGRPEPCPHGDTRAGCEPCHFNEISAEV